MIRKGLRTDAAREKWLLFLAVSFLVAVPIFLFSPVFLFDKAIYGFDLITLHVPFRAEIQRSLEAHEWPLWMPGVLGGMPGIAACNLFFLYPSDLISTLAGWSVQTQFGLDAGLHVALAGIGMFLFLRRLDRSVSGALLGAFFFAVSGSEVSQLFGGYYNFVEGIALMPWAFWAAHKGVKEGSMLSWGLCGLFFSLQIMAQATQIVVYTLVAVAAFVLILERERNIPGSDARSMERRMGGRLSALRGLGLALGLTSLLAAPQLWLALQYLPWCTRHGYSHAEFISGSIGLSETISWLVPGFFGWHTPTYHGPMGAVCVTEYFGLLPWALAAGAIFAFWRREARVRWMAALALTALFFAQRQWTPFYALFSHVPVVSSLRIWSRILFLLTFAVCVLAAFGWDALRAAAHRKAAFRGAMVFAALALAAVAIAWGFAREQAIADGPKPGRFNGSVEELRRMNDILFIMARGSAQTTLMLIPLLGMVLWLGTWRLGTGAALILALAFHVQDQKTVFHHFVQFMGPQGFVDRSNFGLLLPPASDQEPWRVYDTDSALPNRPVLHGYENLGGLESVPMQSYQRIMDSMGQRRKDWFGLMNERYLFSGFRSTFSAQGDQVMIYENHDVFPRAWLVGQSRRVAGDEQAYTLLADPAFNPRTEVALTVDSGLNTSSGLQDSVPKGGVHWLDRSPQTYALDVSTDRNAVLVLSNAWYPSWRCKVDGQDTSVLKADGGLQAVILKAGRHRVDFRFDNGLFYDALAACFAGLVFLLGLWWKEVQTRRTNVKNLQLERS